MFSGVSLILWAECAFLAFVSNPSSDGIVIKIHDFFGFMFVNTEYNLIVRSVETGLGK